MKVQTLDVYYPLFTNTKRVLLSYGGAGAGKSDAAALNVAESGMASIRFLHAVRPPLR